MKRLFSNKKINKSREDISGYTCRDGCTYSCGGTCSGMCNSAASYYGCGSSAW